MLHGMLAVGPGLCGCPVPVRLCIQVSAEGVLSDECLHWSLLLQPGWEEVNCAPTWLLLGVFFIPLSANPLFLSSYLLLAPNTNLRFCFAF